MFHSVPAPRSMSLKLISGPATEKVIHVHRGNGVLSRPFAPSRVLEAMLLAKLHRFVGIVTDRAQRHPRSSQRVVGLNSTQGTASARQTLTAPTGQKPTPVK